MVKEIFTGVFKVEDRLATLATLKERLFGEELNGEYRLWDPTRSKLGAAIMKGLKQLPIRQGSKILYLGAAHGFTPSYVADIVGTTGIVYALEFSERPFNELLPVCEKYENIVPILADARKPEQFSWVEKSDVLYVDIAQPDQTDIAIRVAKDFLKRGGHLMLAIKTQSIDITKSPKKVTDEQVYKLKAAGFQVLELINLEPFEERHFFVSAKMF
ncbi:MAG TPA: fibrillarin-like rRNA/tRNA 2'-O-methyltransferase [archaeon]|nr:fibrillarin-like rRNA/tRNA 2'-O-methyltransferase [archaeon]